MQPRQARRGTAAIAATTLGVGVLLVLLAVILGGCGGGSAAPASSSSGASPSASATTSAPTPAATTSAPASSAPATTAAPSASGGAASTVPPVGLDQAGTFTSGVTATVISIEPITATAALPGEVAGPAVRLTLAVQNGGSTALDLGNVTVDLQDAAGISATPLTGNGATPFTGVLAPGGSSTGGYVFSLATDDRSGVRLYLTASAALPVVVFQGDLG